MSRATQRPDAVQSHVRKLLLKLAARVGSGEAGKRLGPAKSKGAENS